MTKKDYKLIADVISTLNGYWSDTETTIREYVCEALIPALKANNERFDVNKFRFACGRK